MVDLKQVAMETYLNYILSIKKGFVCVCVGGGGGGGGGGGVVCMSEFECRLGTPGGTGFSRGCTTVQN